MMTKIKGTIYIGDLSEPDAIIEKKLVANKMIELVKKDYKNVDISIDEKNPLKFVPTAEFLIEEFTPKESIVYWIKAVDEVIKDYRKEHRAETALKEFKGIF